MAHVLDLLQFDGFDFQTKKGAADARRGDRPHQDRSTNLINFSRLTRMHAYSNTSLHY